MERLLLVENASGQGWKPLPLTPREKDVVKLVAQGLKNREIGERLSIAERTVKNHLMAIYDKLGLADRLSLTLYAKRHGLD